MRRSPGADPMLAVDSDNVCGAVSDASHRGGVIFDSFNVDRRTRAGNAICERILETYRFERDGMWAIPYIRDVGSGVLTTSGALAG